MTNTVEDFIKDKLPVVSVRLDDSLADVAKQIIEHDYSQLPVVDSENRSIGMITSDSILRALNNYKVSLEDIQIKHALQKNPKSFRKDIDLLDLFDEMNGPYGVIVDDEQKLIQIITNYDTAEYFQQRANDILLVENIENTLKDYIQLSFGSVPDGEDKLDQAIQSMTNSTLALQEKFKKALQNYLGKVTDKSPADLDEDAVNMVSEKYFDDKRPSATFDDLTLAHYISLFLHGAFWSHFENALDLNKAAVINILEDVRRTRNDLSHFREISRDQSYQLRDCYDLLVNHQDEINQAFAHDESVAEELTEPSSTPTEEEDHVPPVEDEPAPGESKYAPLAIWLQELPPEKNLVKPTFAKIEEVIGGKLPDSAYKNRSWWANDSVGHVQSKQWLEVGWRVASVNMTTQVVRFARMKDRQKGYIDFFGAILHELKEEPGFQELYMRSSGANYHWIKGVSVKEQYLASFNYSFGRGRAFRVELYIDSGDQDLNKKLFDGLADQKESVENEIGRDLSWQRLDKKRASRISWVFRGHIMDSDEELSQLRQKAIPAMVRYVKVMKPKVEAVAQELL